MSKTHLIRTYPETDRREGGANSCAETRSEDAGAPPMAGRQGRATKSQAKNLPSLPTRGFGVGSNLVTFLNIFCGFKAIIFSFNNQFSFAAYAIITAVILDGLDGWIARLMRVDGEFGRELDSLADAVSFGVAPAVLAYNFAAKPVSLWPVAVTFLYAASSVFRLAKYNVTPKQDLKNYFYGLPTTISAGMVASVILLLLKFSILPKAVVFILIVILAVLMVSNIKYPNLEGIKKISGIKILSIFTVIMSFCLFFAPEITLFSALAVYLISPCRLKKFLTRVNTTL